MKEYNTGLDCSECRDCETQLDSGEQEIPKFYIINEFDRPDEVHVAQLINENNELEYLHSSLRTWCEEQGYKLNLRSTSNPLEDFGFEVTVDKDIVTFAKVRGSVVKYSDGKKRHWQGRLNFRLKIK